MVKKDRPERVNTGITLPRPLLQQVDTKRGDIPRTRYIQRILERHLATTVAVEEHLNENENDKEVALIANTIEKAE